MLHVSCTELQLMLSTTMDKAMETLKMLLTVAAHRETLRVLDVFQSTTGYVLMVFDGVSGHVLLCMSVT